MASLVWSTTPYQAEELLKMTPENFVSNLNAALHEPAVSSGPLSGRPHGNLPLFSCFLYLLTIAAKECSPLCGGRPRPVCHGSHV
jgi:hypothetical protein